MDIASLLGIVLGLAMTVFGILSNKAELLGYIDVPSVIITIGGSITGVLGSFKLSDFINGFKSFALVFKEDAMDPGEIIGNVINLANVARKEGLLALETELACLEDRHKKVIGFWEKWAELGPAWGMIGTLIGLVNMLNNMEDASAIGPAMAVALLTTLYGSMIANWLCTPIASKMKVNNDLEVIVKDVMVEGLLSIQAGENPRVIEEKLKSFLSPAIRDSVGTSGGEE